MGDSRPWCDCSTVHVYSMCCKARKAALLCLLSLLQYLYSRATTASMIMSKASRQVGALGVLLPSIARRNQYNCELLTESRLTVYLLFTAPALSLLHHRLPSFCLCLSCFSKSARAPSHFRPSRSLSLVPLCISHSPCG